MNDEYYRAVYLMQRTLKDFVNEVSRKSGIEASKVIRTVRIKNESMQVLFDDDTTRELPEGQDMITEFQEIHSQTPMKHEWDPSSTDIQVDGDVDVLNTTQRDGYELRLHF
jgi:outer membrane protein OmpA-like peptidoglycan-associated protein